MKKVLFLSHDASRTGAPILLLRLMDLLLSSNEYKSCAILRRPGPLKESFKTFGDTLVFPQPMWTVYDSQRLIVKVFSLIFSPIRLLFFKIKARSMSKVDVIFANTLTHGRLLKMIWNRKTKVITYVHELEFITTFFNKEAEVKFLLSNSNIIAVPCDHVANYVAQAFQVDRKIIRRLNYYVDITHIDRHGQVSNWVAPRDKFIIVGCGTIDRRKGFDLFCQTASSLVSMRGKTEFQFYWIGKHVNDAFSTQSFLDIQKLNLGEVLIVVPEVENVFEYLRGTDVFFLPSREDPYPVVVLEAAFLSVPTICFDKSGGIVEFIEDDAGWIVPYLDAEKAAKKISSLMDNRHIVRKAGEVAKSKVLTRHSAEVVKQQLSDILK